MLEQRIAARVATRPGMTYANVKGQNAQGQPTDLAALVKPGKYTLVDFWASWCPWCIKEIPNLKELLNRYGSKGLEIVGVAVRDTPEDTAKSVAKQGITWPVLYNTDMAAYDAYGFAGIPHHLLIGPDGKIIFNGCNLNQIIQYLDTH